MFEELRPTHLLKYIQQSCCVMLLIVCYATRDGLCPQSEMLSNALCLFEISAVILIWRILRKCKIKQLTILLVFQS